MAQSAKNGNPIRLWGGRFTGEIGPLMDQFNESLSFDRVFYAQDIKGSIAYARANVKTGILTKEEFSKIEDGLRKALQEWQENKFKPAPGDEDIHFANERRLGELIGKNIAGKLHTGRNRNDQVATDMRMWLRDELNLIEHYATAFQSDLERLRFTRSNMNKLRLGRSAVAGNAFGIDTLQMAEELGFEGLIMNSMSAVSDRDFVVEMLQCASTIGSHLSRWSKDLIIYSSLEFGYIKLADAYTTGSSLMPQKKNSDSLERVASLGGYLGP
ncbi:MAG: hypothetical protein Q9227_007698 [Pyrenula ochraceoflavens]